MDNYINVVLIIAALALTFYLLRRKVNLGYIMLIDSAFVILIAKMPAGKALDSALKGALSADTIMLVVLLFLIMTIENIMRNSGMIRKMTDNLKELVGSNRTAAWLLPMVIGLMPSPGGARFSCPMVEEVVGMDSGDLDKSFINYWFRHIWLDGFILYPGVIVAAGLLKVSVISLFLHLVPFMAVSLLLGIVFGLTRIKKEKIKRSKPAFKSLVNFLSAMLPVIIVITVYISLLNVTKYSLEIASGSMAVILFAVKRYDFKKIVKTAREAFPVRLVIILVGVMVFKEILLDSGAISGLSSLLSNYGIPVSILFVLLPFLGAFTSGITVSYVSLSFPILIPLGLGSNLWLAALVYVAGSIGNMVTPLHLCAVMTADYFKSPLGKLLKRIAIAEVPMFLIAAVMLFILVRA